MTIHNTPHTQSNMKVIIKKGTFKGEFYVIKDWWDRVSGKSWMFDKGNPACIEFAVRNIMENHPIQDDEVVYGKIGIFGKLIHISQL